MELRPISWRTRWAWRRTARRIVAEHTRATEATLDRLHGSVVGGAATGESTPSGTIAFVLPGWRITLAEVSAVARCDCTALVQGGCHLSGGGRYGPFWWLAFTRDCALPGRSPARSIVLGSRLVISVSEDQPPTASPVPEPEPASVGAPTPDSGGTHKEMPQ